MYICHYCADYTTESVSDMSKHVNRKKKCKCNTLYNYEEAQKLSKERKYVFLFDIDKLIKDDFIYIVSHYLEKENKLESNFRNQNSNSNSNSNIVQTNIIDENKDKFICSECKSVFTRKFNLVRHLKNPDNCMKQKENNEILQKNKEMLSLIIEKEKNKEKINNTFINNNNNTQNINNIQNNNNNTNHNTYNMNIKDFIKDNYDISHITNDFYAQKDCFLYHNFLRVIMENKRNQNIFFSENEAIIYTDNELNKMSSDKAGYMILDKLSTSFNQLLYRQDDETQNFYSFIQKYYYVIKGHYKHDTIFKDYDVDKRQFVYTANSSSFRSRDKYLTKMSGVLSKFKNNTRENMMVCLDEIKDIPILNPNIEDFASIKMRYRDLKDKD